MHGNMGIELLCTPEYTYSSLIDRAIRFTYTVVAACYVCTNIKFLCESLASVHVPRIIVTGPTHAVAFHKLKRTC